MLARALFSIITDSNITGIPIGIDYLKTILHKHLSGKNSSKITDKIIQHHLTFSQLIIGLLPISRTKFNKLRLYLSSKNQRHKIVVPLTLRQTPNFNCVILTATNQSFTISTKSEGCDSVGMSR